MNDITDLPAKCFFFPVIKSTTVIPSEQAKDNNKILVELCFMNYIFHIRFQLLFPKPWFQRVSFLTTQKTP